jgi:DNA-binding PadR family transcriptional regulator
MNTKTLSAQMLDVLRLLDRESPTTARQLNDRLYDLTSPQSRRVFAASMSRTLRRLERRELIFFEGGTIAITQYGRFTLRPEMQEAMLNDLRESVRRAVAEAWAEYVESQKPNAEGQNDAASDRPAPGGV